MNYFQMVNDAIDYIENNLHRNVPIKELAERYHLSKFYFTRIFKALTRLNVKEYMTGRKMAEAARRLKTTHNRIIDIAFDYGFESHEAFTRKFRNLFGITPVEFRKFGPKLATCKRIEVVERQFKNLHREMIVDFQIRNPGIVNLVGKPIRFNPDNVQDIEQVKTFFHQFVAAYVQGNAITRMYLVTGEELAPDNTINYFSGFPPMMEKVPDGLSPMTLAASDYAVFRYKNGMEGIHRTVAADVWNAILLSGLSLNPIGIHFFELYERGYNRSKQFLLYVPIKQ